MPRAAVVVVVVVEDRYAAVFKHDHIRPVTAADGLAELQVRWPNVPMVFCDTRDLAQEWTYRFLAAAARYAAADAAAAALTSDPSAPTAAGPEPSAAELRAWARQAGLPVPDRGRIPATVRTAWHQTHSQQA
jgi:hypothetical protein